MSSTAFHEELPATAGSMAGLRQLLRAWIEDEVRGLSVDGLVDDVVIATNEAVANAVEHGSLGPASTVRVHVECCSGVLTVEVSDSGGPPAGADPDPSRGRGLGLMGALMDSVELVRAPDGTVVRMRRRVG